MVHRGELLPTHTPVAVKRVVAADAAARAQVLRDVAALATPPGTAPPPGLVPLLGAYAEGGGGRVALVLALMEGGSLADAVARTGEDAGLPEPVLGEVACGVVAGLNYIHGVKRMVSWGGEKEEGWIRGEQERSQSNAPTPHNTNTGAPRHQARQRPPGRQRPRPAGRLWGGGRRGGRQRGRVHDIPRDSRLPRPRARAGGGVLVSRRRVGVGD